MNLSADEILRIIFGFIVFNVIGFLLMWFFPQLGLFSYLIALVFGILAFRISGPLLEIYTGKQVEKDAVAKKQYEKQLVKNYLDTNKCLSCNSILPSDANHCPQCGFDMTKYK